MTARELIHSLTGTITGASLTVQPLVPDPDPAPDRPAEIDILCKDGRHHKISTTFGEWKDLSFAIMQAMP